MAPKVMLFAGAPAASTVDEASCTLDHFDKVFCTFMGSPTPSNGQQPSHNASTIAATHATWRSLPLTKLPLHTGFSQAHHFQDASVEGNHDFFTTMDVSVSEGASQSTDGAELTQFCEHSLSVHNPLPSSQLDPESFDQSATSITDSSFMTNSSKNSMAPPPIPCHLSDVADVQPAPRILELIPQTITVNLIVGIISIAHPRTVTTRWGRTLSLIEILVGDETKSGFGVTFWLSRDSVPESQLNQLQRQDVVLLRNVALRVFRDKVYGQSLRKGLTQISLLWRRDGSGYYSTRDLAKRDSPAHPQQAKTKQVKNWVLNFVGGDKPRNTKTPRKSWDQPPDDTQ